MCQNKTKNDNITCYHFEMKTQNILADTPMIVDSSNLDFRTNDKEIDGSLSKIFYLKLTNFAKLLSLSLLAFFDHGDF